MAALVLLAAGCSYDFTPPSGAAILCDAQRDCPAGWRCQEAIRRCVPVDLSDSVAPSVSGLKLENDHLGLGGTATLSFDVSERLLLAPQVEVDLSGRKRPLTPEPADLAGTHFRFTLLATGDEPQDAGGCPIAIVLTDAAGNQSAPIAAGPVFFDFLRPSVSDVVVPEAPASAVRDAQVSFKASKALGPGSPVVRLDTGAAFDVDASAAPTYIASFRAKGTESEAAKAKILVDLRDLAGNAADGVLLGELRFDFTAPGVAAASELPPAVRPGARVPIEFEVSESLGTLPGVRVGDSALSGRQLSELRFSFEFTPPDLSGALPVTVHLEDRAGNGADLSLGSIVVDGVPPDLVQTPSILDSPLVRLAAPVSLSFDVTEDLASDPEVAIQAGGTALLWTRDAASHDRHYVFTYAASGGEPQAQDFPVSIRLVDLAGNERTTTLPESVRFDFVAPKATQAAIEGSPARLGQLVRVTFGTSETLSGEPAVRLSSGRPLTKDPASTPALWVFTYTSASGDAPGDLQLVADLKDLAGNLSSGEVLGSVAFDFTAPSLVGAVRFLNTPAKADANVSILFESSEPLKELPEVRVAGVPVVGKALSGTAFEFQYRVAASDGAAPRAVSVVLTDLAGNSSTFTEPQVPKIPVDLLAPDATGVAISTSTNRPAAKAGTVVTVEFTATEPLARLPTVSLGSQAMTCLDEGSQRFSCSVAVSSQAEGPAALVALLEDAAHNDQAVKLGAIVLDFQAPALVAGKTSLEPAYPANPLASATAATNGTVVRVSFSFSEPLAADSPPPHVVAYQDAALTTAFDFALESAVGSSYTFVATLGSLAPAEFTDEVRILVTPAVFDDAGNALSSTLRVATFAVDTLPPAAPDAADAAKILFRRVPYGSKATAGRPQFTLSGLAGSLPADAVALTAYTSQVARVGTQGSVTGGGFPSFALDMDDRATVSVAAVDAAGNESARVEVKNVVWVGTPSGALPSPLKWSTTFDFVSSRVQDFASPVSSAEAEKVSQEDGERLIARQKLDWRERNGLSSSPMARLGPAVAFDPVRGRLYLFGGAGIFGNCPSEGGCILWEYDVTRGSWTALPGTTPMPTPRSSGAMAWDTRRDKLVLHGGQGAAPACETSGCRDIWEWDPTTRRWTDRTPASRPPARWASGTAYDSWRDKVFIMGGKLTPTGTLADFWEWDAVSGAWLQLPDPGFAMGFYPSLAFDTDRGVLLALPGCGVTSGGTVYEWDPATSAWSTRATTSTPPQQRCGGAFAYSPRRKRAVLFGGQPAESTTTRLNDTWTWDTATGAWEPVAVGPSVPTPRTYFGSAMDVTRDQLLVVAGAVGLAPPIPCTNYNASGGACGDTWHLDLATSTWGDRSPEIFPIWRSSFALSYDSARKNAVMLGGTGGPTPPNDTWLLSSSTGAWRMLSAAGAPPKGDLGSYYLAFDESNKQTLLFPATSTTETWTFDGSWTNRGVLSPTPPPCTNTTFYPGMAWSPSRQTVLFTCNPAAIWEWNGVWTRNPSVGNLSPAPSASFAGSFAWDPVADGLTYLQDATALPWLWKNGAWSQATAPAAFGARSNVALGTDPVRKRVLLFGGTTNGSPSGDRNDLWEWDGSGWSQLPTTAVLAYRTTNMSRPSFVYDATRNTMVLVSFPPRSPTDMVNNQLRWWDLAGGAGGRTAQLVELDLAALGVNAAGECKGIDVRLAAGGLGDGPSGPNDGAELWLWSNDYWHSVATNSAAPGAPASLAWSSSDPASKVSLGTTLTGDGRTLSLAVTPANPNGSVAGEVDVDYAEVTVWIRRP